ncbi:histidine kinase/DNA gyrase B/HSP90-like ATPase [Lachnotalea glycerini]|jgi:sensor histidine kinase YesM|uniref:histidine kinase n=1 Tax=Lachnotalea glycerini TaxID=1763509 RepID=A0A255I8N4_9FIRM|nr:histidine kinase [Lachnotalea glycerini]PXV95664.1 histidine kinase/DNA gyrase B/HSP90-like ATPase [Lachnotalea glycerini]RDY33288.1 HAMP domain-containing protein [Lachnotalea glycerini]
MKLKNKLLISQIIVFLTMFITLNTVLSKIVYMTVSKTDCENAMTLNEQIMTRIDQYFEELERFTLVVANDEMLNVLIETYNKEPTNANESKIRLYLSGLGIRDKIQSYAVLGIYVNVQNSKKELHFTTVGLSSSLKNYVQNTIPTISLDNTTGKFIDPFTYDGDSTTVFGNKFNMAYGFISPYSVNQMQGSVTVIASFDQIIYIAENMKDYSHDYLLLDNQNEAIKPSVENSKIDITKALSHLTYGKSYKEGFFKEKDAITTVRYSDYGEWKLVCRLTRADILKNNSSLILLDQILVAVFGICVVLIMIPLVQKFTRPLSKVSEQMGEIARGNLKARVVVKSEDEIAEVGRAFNIMAKKLQENIDKMLEQEKREQKMRYSLMISQVDPHFIYNTMNTITYLAQKERSEDVIAVNKAMIEILKDRLRVDIKNVFDTLEQEIKVVEQYLIIQNYRYADTFKAQINIQDEVKTFYVAKNVLQPLVENALFHGVLCNKDEDGETIGGCITINAIQANTDILISVKDNGIGMSEQMLEKLEEQSVSKIRGEHIGIRNIKGRIRYIYGENCSFIIQSKEGEGTEVIIKLPVIRENGGNIDDIS